MVADQVVVLAGNGADSQAVAITADIIVTGISVEVQGALSTQAQASFYSGGAGVDGIAVGVLSGAAAGFYTVPIADGGYEAKGLYYDKLVNPVGANVNWYVYYRRL